MWWLVDSGASQSVVVGSRATLQSRGIEIGDSHHGNVHGMFHSQRSSVPSFRYHAPPTPEIRGYVLGHTSFPRLLKTEGIIGVNTLTQNRAIMLLSEKQLLWHRQGVGNAGGTRIKINRHPTTGLFVLHCRINEHPATLLVDTGASRSILAYSNARRFKLALKQTTLSLHGIQRSQHSVFRIKKLTLMTSRGVPIHSGEFLATDLSSIRKRLAAEGNLRIDGILGYDWLSRNLSAIDFGNGFLIKH